MESLDLRTIRGRDREREREREREKTRTIFQKDTQSLFNTLYMCVFNEHFYTSP